MVDNGYVPDVDYIDAPSDSICRLKSKSRNAFEWVRNPYTYSAVPEPKYFHLSLDMAKELACAEGGKKGKVVKRYLQSFDMHLQAQYALEAFPAEGVRWMESRTIPPFPKTAVNLSTMGKSVEPVSSPEPVAASPSVDIPASLQLIPVFNGTIQNQTVQLCNARDLHAFLKVGRDFSNWIKARVAEYGFSEGEDFITAETLSSPKLASSKARCQRMTDYHLTLDMGRELGMVERNEQGRQIRRYFIECERHLLLGATKPAPVAVSAPANTIPGLNINEDEFFLRVYNALGRENGKATLLVQLVKMGGIDKWITATTQKIVEAANGKISKSSVHYNAKRLIDEGLIAHKSHQYYVFGEALRARINP